MRHIASKCALSGSFFFNNTATTEIYTLSLHDALPISRRGDLLRHAFRRRLAEPGRGVQQSVREPPGRLASRRDRKSTRLNSSHSQISYAVFCLKKKKHRTRTPRYSCPNYVRF